MFKRASSMSSPILVTGAAGFIGYHVAERLLALGFAPAGEYELLAKRLAQPVRISRPVRAAVETVATV